MPREFQDFSHEVSQGTDKIVKGLDDVRGAADNADVASGKLSKTQDRGVRSGDSYAKSMAGISKQLSGVSSIAKDVARGFSTTDSSVRSLGSSLSSIRSSAGEATTGLATVLDVSKEVATSLEKISGKKIDINFDIKAAKAARQAIDDINDAYEKVPKVPRAPKVPKAPKAPKIPETDKLEKNFKEITKSIKELQGELVKLEASADSLDDIQKNSFIKFNIDLSSAKEFEDFVGGLDKSQQAFYTTIAATEGLDIAIEELAGKYDVFNAKLRISKRESEETAKASKLYAEEVAEITGLQKNLNDKLEEGAGEAKGFASGLGVGNGMAIGAGVAVAYLATKVAGLIDEWKDSAVELSNFNVQLASLENRAQGLGFAGSFSSLRDELNLTRDQSLAFFKVLEDGVQSGVISVNELSQAALQLRETFGGDQTARLEEYVNLLKDIPTLDADLSVTASLDDQAASIFELAQQGKISTIIDLQTAGLAGGIQVDALSPEDTELINAAQNTEKTIEDVQDTLLSYFPSWGPMFSAGVGGLAKVAAGIGAVVAGLGVLSALGGSQILAQGTTTAAVLATGGIDVASDVGKSISKNATPGIMKGLKSLLPKILGGGATAAASTGGTGAVVGGLASNPVGWAIAIGVAVIAISAGIAWAGDKMSDFGDDLIADGKKIQGGFAKIQGASLKVAAGFLLLGPIGGIASAFIFAADDLIDGLDAIGSGLQAQVGEYNKYGDGLVEAGKVLQDFSASLDETIDDVKKGFVQGAKALFNGIIDTIPGADIIKQAVTDIFVNKDLQKARAGLADEVEAIDKELGKLKESSDSYGKSLEKLQKRQQASWLSLERELNRIKAAVNSAQIRFQDFSTEVDNLNLENLADFGGTASQFDQALGDAVSGVKKRFDILSDTLSDRRADIIKDGTLDAKERRNALLQLKKEELVATKTFVDGINKAVQALFNVPQLIQAGLEKEIAGAKFDIRREEGTGGIDVLLKESGKQFNALDKEMTETFKAINKSTKINKEASATIGDSQLKAADKIKSIINDLPDATQKKLRGLDLKDAEAVANAAEEFTDSAKKTEAELEKLTEGIPTTQFDILAKKSAQAAKGSENAKKDIENLSNEINELGSKTGSFTDTLGITQETSAVDPEKIAKKEADLEEAKARQKKFAADEAKLAVKIDEEYFETLKKQLKGKLTEKEIRKSLTNISKSISNGNAQDVDDLIRSKSLKGDEVIVSEEIRKMQKRSEELNKGAIPAKKEELRQQTQLAETVQSLANQYDIITNSKKNELVSLEKLVELVKSGADLGGDVVNAVEVSARAEQRKLDALKSEESLALLTNTASENVLKQREMQNKVSAKSLDAVEKGIKELRRRQAKILSAPEPANDEQRAVRDSSVAKLESNIVDLKKLRGEAIEALGRTGDSINEAIEKFNDSVSGRRIQQEFDLSDTLAELASFSNDYANIIEQSTDIAISAAKRKAREERKILAESLAQEEKNLQAKAGAIKDPKAKAIFLQEGKSLLISKKKTREADIELRQKQKVVDAAEKEASLKLEAIGLDEELLNAQMDFLSEVGGSFSSILKLQNAGVQLERDKLAVLKEQLEEVQDSKVGGLKLLKAENAYKIQGLKVRKAEFGIQKDIFEKLIGKAFGEIRSDLGAAKRRGSDIGIMGRGRTRVKGRNGLFLKGGAEAGKSIDERRADRVLGKLAGLGGKKDKAGKGEEEGEGPKRLDIESQMANFKSNKETAKATSDLAKAGLERGSIFTHDVTTEDLLKQISGNTGTLVSGSEALQSVIMDGIKWDKSKFVEGAQTSALEFEKEMAGSATKQLSSQEKLNKLIESEDNIRNNENSNPFAGNSQFTDPDFQRIMSGKPSAEQIELQEKVADEVKKVREADRANVDDITKTTPAEAEAVNAPASNMSVAPETTDKMSAKHKQRQDVGNMEDVGNVDIPDEVINNQGGSSTGAESGMTLSVQGQINITMDTQLFRAQMANLVAEAISTPEVRSQLNKQGFINGST